MLEHQKIVLQNVSHDPEMFRKELNKSIAWLPSYEVIKLYTWVKQKFGNRYKSIIKQAFDMMAA